MKIFLKLFLLMILPVYMQAQTTVYTDSLKRLLNNEKQDTVRVKLLLQLCQAFFYSKPDTVLVLGQQALHLSRQAGFAVGEIQSIGSLASAFMTMGNNPKALALSLEALEKAEVIDDKIYIVRTLGSIGNIYTSQGEYQKALNYHFKTLDLSEKIEYKEGVLFSVLSIGDIYERTGQLDSAIFYTERGYQLALQQTKPGFMGTALLNLANIYSKQGQDTLSMNLYRRSLSYFQELNDEMGFAEVYLGMARLFQKSGQTDSCLYYARQSLVKAQHGGFTSYVLSASKFLSNYYSTQHQLDSAFVYQSTAITAKDSLFSQEKARYIHSLEYEEAVKQQQIIQAEAEAQNRLKFIILLCGLFTLCIVAILLWRNNRQKEKAQKKIEKAYTELNATQSQLIQSEKMASLGELTAGIAHEIQNPLNFVNNFSDVNKELTIELGEEIDKGNYSDAKEIAKVIRENQEKINHHGKRADAIVKGMLMHSRSSNGKKELTDINALTDEYLRLAYHGLRAKDKTFNATLKTDYDERIGNINIISQEIGRAILNLITNAFYAVNEKKKQLPDDYEPIVTLSTKRIEGKVEIRITDNGNGIPQKLLDKIFQPFFTTKPTGQGTGLGLSLSYDIVKAHGGEIKVNTKEARPDDLVGRGEGSEFIIQLPTN